jgi:serine/threonine protein kinase
VTDFGLSTIVNEPCPLTTTELGRRDSQLMMKSACGSAAYAAPELLQLLLRKSSDSSAGTAASSAAALPNRGAQPTVQLERFDSCNTFILPETADQHPSCEKTNSESNPAACDQSVDIWALGLILCVLITGQHPLSNVPREDYLPVMRGKLLDFSEQKVRKRA